MPAATPTARTLNALRKRGFIADVVERWLPVVRIRKDLFGILDVVAVGHGMSVGIQLTTAANTPSRVRKLQESPALYDLLRAGWTIQVWGWRKPGKLNQKWSYRVVHLGGPISDTDNVERLRPTSQY